MTRRSALVSLTIPLAIVPLEALAISGCEPSAMASGGASVGIAVARHAGTVSIVQTVTGPVSMQTGKDLGSVTTVIGTGGVLAHGADPAAALAHALADPAKPQSLRPKDPELRLDGDYLLFACGLLAGVEPEAALTLGLAHMHPVGGT